MDEKRPCYAKLYDDLTREYLGVIWREGDDWFAETPSGRLIARCADEAEARGLLAPIREDAA